MNSSPEFCNYHPRADFMAVRQAASTTRYNNGKTSVIRVKNIPAGPDVNFNLIKWTFQNSGPTVPAAWENHPVLFVLWRQFHI